MGPFRGPYRGSPLRDPCWWAVTTEVAAHWEEVLMGPFRGGTHSKHKSIVLAFLKRLGLKFLEEFFIEEEEALFLILLRVYIRDFFGILILYVSII